MNKVELAEAIIGKLGDAGFEFKNKEKPNNKEFVEIIVTNIIQYIQEKALVTGTTPAGGPMNDGKVQ
jgi:hypothetical protein